MKPYNYHAEPPVNPPDEVDNAEYDRLERNSNRRAAIWNIKSLTYFLDEIGHDGEHRQTQKYLDELLDYLQRDMEY